MVTILFALGLRIARLDDDIRNLMAVVFLATILIDFALIAMLIR